MSDALRVYRRSEIEAIKPTIDSDGCLHRFRAIWVEGVEDSSDVATVGIGFHAANHSYVLRLLDARLGQDRELADEAFVDGAATAQIPSRLVPQLRDVWNWHAESFELPLDRFVAAEERVSSGNVGFCPDLVLAHPENNSLEIVDFKSGWAPPMTPAELKVLLQARVYSKYGQDRWPGFSRYLFTLNAVRFRKSVTVSFTPSELDAVDVEVRAAIATIEEAHRTNTWPATPGPACHWCELACPVADQSVTLPKRMPLEMLPRLLQWISVAERDVRAAKKLAKQAIGVFGPQTVNGMEWANRPIVSQSYPVDALVDVLKLRGLAGAFEDASAQELTISRSALSKLLKQYPMLVDDLKGVVKEKTSYRFSAKSTAALLEDSEADDE